VFSLLKETNDKGNIISRFISFLTYKMSAVSNKAIQSKINCLIPKKGNTRFTLFKDVNFQ
jgi:hypothetical protein